MAEKNELIRLFEEQKKELKNRGKSLSKDEFFNAVSKLLTPETKNQILYDLTPMRWHINSKMDKDPDFEMKILKMI